MNDAHPSTPEDCSRRLISADVRRASDGGLALKARRSEHGRYELTNARLPTTQSLTPVTFGEGDRLVIISFSRPGLNACPSSRSGYSTQRGRATAGFHHESMSHATYSRACNAARDRRPDSASNASTCPGGIGSGTTAGSVEEESLRTCPPRSDVLAIEGANSPPSGDSTSRQSDQALAHAFFFSSVWYHYGTTTTTEMTRPTGRGISVVPQPTSEERRGGAA